MPSPVVLASLAAVALSACGGGGGADPVATTAPPASSAPVSSAPAPSAAAADGACGLLTTREAATILGAATIKPPSTIDRLHCDYVPDPQVAATAYLQLTLVVGGKDSYDAELANARGESAADFETVTGLGDGASTTGGPCTSSWATSTCR